jgi:peptidoglycan biosynthesis protein MviN/MurJ (putative lipid II flippase)
MSPARRTGTEPATARSATRLRLVLACFGALTCAIATVWLADVAAQHTGRARSVVTVLAVLVLVGAVVAVADAVVLVRRRRSDRV